MNKIIFLTIALVLVHFEQSLQAINANVRNLEKGSQTSGYTYCAYDGGGRDQQVALGSCEANNMGYGTNYHDGVCGVYSNDVNINGKMTPEYWWEIDAGPEGWHNMLKQSDLTTAQVDCPPPSSLAGMPSAKHR